ncbi:MAG: hypothetical protein KY468_14615 [Armatimonadetes bacterium]|nr:hypothetical protein [Armatimonadota bacterium]
MTALLLLARYAPIATVLASLMAAAVYNPHSPLLRKGLMALWGAVVAANVVYIFYFFLSIFRIEGARPQAASPEGPPMLPSPDRLSFSYFSLV